MLTIVVNLLVAQFVGVAKPIEIGYNKVLRLLCTVPRQASQIVGVFFPPTFKPAHCFFWRSTDLLPDNESAVWRAEDRCGWQLKYEH